MRHFIQSVRVMGSEGGLSQLPGQPYQEGSGQVGSPEAQPGASPPAEAVCDPPLCGTASRHSVYMKCERHTVGTRVRRERLLGQPETVCIRKGSEGTLRPEHPNTLTYFPSCQGFQRIIF